MLVLAAILPVVATSSSSALEIYRVAACEQEGTARDLVRVAKILNQFASILKQTGATIKEDDRLPSAEAIEALKNVIDQAQHILDRVASSIAMVEANSPAHQDDSHQPSTAIAELNYLSIHLEALSATLSVQLQTLFTAQSIMWSKLRPTISPQMTERAVSNERSQLQSLVVEQQILILTAANVFAGGTLGTNGRILMEADSSQSLIASDSKQGITPTKLHRFQSMYISALDLASSHEAKWLPAISSIAPSQVDHLLEHWTNLSKFDDRIRDAAREAQRQKHQERQPTVETDTEDDDNEEEGTMRKATDRSSTEHLRPTSLEQKIAASARSSTARLSVGATATAAAAAAAAAVGAQEEDEDLNLEIPWRLCAKKYYWSFIDAKQVGGNTDQSPSFAYSDRHSWTEILASWACKEAIEEAGFRFTPVQRDCKSRRHKKSETLFMIERPLRFHQIQHLVERTVEIYRRNAPPTPPVPRVRRASFNQSHSKMDTVERNRTPVSRNTHPPLDRQSTAFLAPQPGPPPPLPPPLVRSTSTPGCNSTPSFPPPSSPNQPLPPYPSLSSLHAPAQTSLCSPHHPNHPQSPRYTIQPQQQQQQHYHHHNHHHHQTPSNHPQSPLQHNNHHPPHSQHSHHQNQNQPFPPKKKTITSTSDSESTTTSSTSTSHSTRRSRRPRGRGFRHRRAHDEHRDEQPTERERSREKPRHRDRDRARERRKRGRTSKAAEALLGVGGLTALLDGLGGL